MTERGGGRPNRSSLQETRDEIVRYLIDSIHLNEPPRTTTRATLEESIMAVKGIRTKRAIDQWVRYLTMTGVIKPVGSGFEIIY